MNYHAKRKAARIARAKAMKKLWAGGATLEAIGQMQSPKITRERVRQLIQSLKG